MNLFQRTLVRVFGIPELPAIEEYHQLLRSWRTVLQTCLALEHAVSSAPPEIAIAIVEARGEITRLKTQLRQWGVDVVDLPDELLMGDASEVAHQLSLLAIHRGNLEILLRQHQSYDERDAPLHLINSIAMERGAVAQIKRRLRDWQAPVTDQPQDAA